MVFVKRDRKEFDSARMCYGCGEEFSWMHPKVRDHCHLTGKFRGAAHNGCNLNLCIPRILPVILRNLLHYDAHFFIKKLGNPGAMGVKPLGDIKYIRNNEENYISFSQSLEAGCHTNKNEKKENSKFEIRFVDSVKFMNSSLDGLVKKLTPE